MIRSLAFALVLVSAGCASTAPPLDPAEAEAATASVDAFRSYVRGLGHSLFPEITFDPGLFAVNRQSFTVDGGNGALSVYAFDSEGAMEQAATRLANRSFSLEWNVYKGGRLVVVYVGRDPGLLAGLSRVMAPLP